MSSYYSGQQYEILCTDSPVQRWKTCHGRPGSSLKYPSLSITLANYQQRTLEFGQLGIYSKKTPLTHGTWRNCHSFCWFIFFFHSFIILWWREEGRAILVDSILSLGEILSMQISLTFALPSSLFLSSDPTKAQWYCGRSSGLVPDLPMASSVTLTSLTASLGELPNCSFSSLFI